MESLDLKAARRLALARAGLLRAELTGLPTRAGAGKRRARERCEQVVQRFGYVQLDSIAVTGARTHAIVLCSRLEGLDAGLAESLLEPGAPYFEYWGHEASWLPMALYPCFAFRRRAYRVHPWWGDLLGEHPRLADRLLARIETEGPLRSVDLEGEVDGRGRHESWWNRKLEKRIAEALWMAGDLAIRERRGFQRVYDLAERVIPAEVRTRTVCDEDAMDRLLLLALDGHGWASTGTLAATWRLSNMRPAILASLERLREAGDIVPCELRHRRRRVTGWARPRDMEHAARLSQARLHRGKGVLLSPFDPVLWDRARVQLLFGFEQRIEIYKRPEQRVYGYYCLPVLAGDALVARMDLKADRRAGRLEVRSFHAEDPARSGMKLPRVEAVAATALERYAASVGLSPSALPAPG